MSASMQESASFSASIVRKNNLNFELWGLISPKRLILDLINVLPTDRKPTSEHLFFQRGARYDVIRRSFAEKCRNGSR